MGRHAKQSDLDAQYQLGFRKGKEASAPDRESVFKEAGDVVAQCIADFVKEYGQEQVWKQPYAINRVHHLHWKIQERLEKKYKV